ncbi:hypothetical protein GCM10019016_108280 [Streptomyces prasinosporus]|uniref:PAS fold-4 domain-containing protein n=1 Tax=Streptomyces prasinosporus TaxID=68256 RepID=A0ABP6U7Z2_9ACTN
MICFNAAAVRITAVPAEQALGQRLEEALPLEDLEGRRWWQLTDPYGGLAIRVGSPSATCCCPADARSSSRRATSAPGPPDRSVASSSPCATPRPGAAPSAATPN